MDEWISKDDGNAISGQHVLQEEGLNGSLSVMKSRYTLETFSEVGSRCGTSKKHQDSVRIQASSAATGGTNCTSTPATSLSISHLSILKGGGEGSTNCCPTIVTRSPLRNNEEEEETGISCVIGTGPYSQCYSLPSSPPACLENEARVASTCATSSHTPTIQCSNMYNQSGEELDDATSANHTFHTKEESHVTIIEQKPVLRSANLLGDQQGERPQPKFTAGSSEAERTCVGFADEAFDMPSSQTRLDDESVESSVFHDEYDDTEVIACHEALGSPNQTGNMVDNELEEGHGGNSVVSNDGEGRSSRPIRSVSFGPNSQCSIPPNAPSTIHIAPGDDPEQPSSSSRSAASAPDVRFRNSSAGSRIISCLNTEELAVAVEVSPGDKREGICIPVAVRYDPPNLTSREEGNNEQHPINKTRRRGVWAFFLLAVVLVIVGGSIFYSRRYSQKITSNLSPTTLSPTSIRMVTDIRQQIRSVVGESALNDPESPYSLALWWIIDEDPLELTAKDDGLIQRYILAVFYFFTTRRGPWLSCNRPTGNETSECSYQLPGGAYPKITTQQYRWLSDTHECHWAGIFCDSRNKTRVIQLIDLGIDSEFPPVILHLPFLQSISLALNYFHGTLPSELASLDVVNIQFQHNEFTGQIPTEWFSSTSIQRVNLGDNLLTGTLPTEIGSLSFLNGLFLFDNLISGTLPPEIGNLESLSFLRLSGNHFHGNIPTEIGKLTQLREIWLMNNDMTGTIPTEIGFLSNLTDIRLHSMLISGTLPVEIYSLRNLTRVDCHSNKLSGSINPLIGQSRNLAHFWVHNNFISGTIPTEIGLLTHLNRLLMHINELTGTVPKEVCSLRNPHQLEVLVVDCLSVRPNLPSLVDCQKEDLCCTTCCDRNSFSCIDAGQENTYLAVTP